MFSTLDVRYHPPPGEFTSDELEKIDKEAEELAGHLCNPNGHAFNCARESYRRKIICEKLELRERIKADERKRKAAEAQVRDEEIRLLERERKRKEDEQEQKRERERKQEQEQERKRKEKYAEEAPSKVLTNNDQTQECLREATATIDTIKQIAAQAARHIKKALQYASKVEDPDVERLMTLIDEAEIERRSLFALAMKALELVKTKANEAYAAYQRLEIRTRASTFLEVNAVELAIAGDKAVAEANRANKIIKTACQQSAEQVTRIAEITKSIINAIRFILQQEGVSPVADDSDDSDTPVRTPRPSSIPFEIPFSAIALDHELGRGTYGIVYYAHLRANHLEVAVKKLRLDSISLSRRPQFIEKFQYEILLMKGLRNSSIVTIYNACFEPSNYAIVMEYMRGGSLASKFNLPPPPWKQRWQIALDIGTGLAYLHENNILHRDLKSANILVDEPITHAKISDFGLSRQIDLSHLGGALSPQGTISWMAPELFDGVEYRKTEDIYSLGMVLWEIASWNFPYGGMALAAIIRYVCNGNRETIPADCPASYADLIRRCWDGRIERRPTAITVIEELKAHKLDAETIPIPAPPLAPPPPSTGRKRAVVLSDSGHVWESGSRSSDAPSSSPSARSAFRPFRPRIAASKPDTLSHSKHSPA